MPPTPATDPQTTLPRQGSPDPKDHTVAHIDPLRQTIWDFVSHSPLRSLWDFRGVSVKLVLKRSAHAFMEDNLLSRAAELGYYFLFALFPMLFSASSILGLAAKKASTVYVALLHYLAIVIPHSAFQMVLSTFEQTTQQASGGKITFGLVAALWAASVGFAAIQDTANTVYKVKETRPYWKSKLEAIVVTLLLSVVISVTLAVLLIADYLLRKLRWIEQHHHWLTSHHWVLLSELTVLRIVAWAMVVGLLMLLFAIIYYYAPDVKRPHWHWFTPGAAIGIAGWLAASVGLRVYLHYFDNFAATYGSLGAVIILLTWFYITGLMLLAGAEIDSEIQAAIVEKRLKERGSLPVEAAAEPGPPVQPSSQPASTSSSA